MVSAIRQVMTQFVRPIPKQVLKPIPVRLHVPNACRWKPERNVRLLSKDHYLPTLTIRIPTLKRESEEMQIGQIMQQLHEIQSIALPAESLKRSKEFLTHLFTLIQKGGRTIESIHAIDAKTGKLHGILSFHQFLSPLEMHILVQTLSSTSNKHRFEINLRP